MQREASPADQLHFWRCTKINIAPEVALWQSFRWRDARPDNAALLHFIQFWVLKYDGKERIVTSFIIPKLSGKRQQFFPITFLSLSYLLCACMCASSPLFSSFLFSSCHICSSFYETQMETKSFMIF